MRSGNGRFRGGKARTPAFDTFARALRRACLADRPGSPPLDEIVGRIGEARRTRRDALKGAAAAVLAFGQIDPRTELPERPRAARVTAPRVVVVGAGIAGLSAAYELKKAGVRARVFEAATRAGGRILTVKGRLGPGLVTELGGEFIDSEHDEMLGLVKALGLELIDTRAVPDPSLAREAYFFGGIHHSQGQAVEALRPLAGRMAADARRLGRPGGYRNNPDAIDLDRASIAEYLDRIGARGWIRALIDTAFVAEFGLDCDRLSAINLLIMISTDLARGEVALYGESDERYKVRGGCGQIVGSLASRLQGQVEFGHRLESVREAGAGLHLDFSGPGGRTAGVEADFAILAVPFSVLRRVALRVELPERKREAILELGYGTNSKLVAGFRGRPWRERGYVGAVFSDEPFQTAWEHTRPQQGEASGLTFFAGGQAGLDFGAGTAEEQVARLLPRLEAVYTGASRAFNGRVDRYQWPTAPFALGSYACYKPGQWTTIAGVEGTPAGSLFFAGEHCLFGDSGYMNSGAVSGRATARALLARVHGRGC